jgi:hypothetical protein
VANKPARIYERVKSKGGGLIARSVSRLKNNSTMYLQDNREEVSCFCGLINRGAALNDSMCALSVGFADDQRTPAILSSDAPASMIQLRSKIPNQAHLLDGRTVLYLGSRIVSTIDSATFSPRLLPALWSVRKCWPA